MKTTHLLNSTTFLPQTMNKYSFADCWYSCPNNQVNFKHFYHNDTTNDCQCLPILREHYPLAYRFDEGTVLGEIMITRHH